MNKKIQLIIIFLYISDMSSDIRNFFTKKKIKVRYESNSLSEKRKQRKAKLEKGPRQATIESLGRVIVIEGKGWAL